MLLVICLPAGKLPGQLRVYEDAYRAAYADSVITEDELNILQSVQTSLGLEEEDILEISRKVTVSRNESGTLPLSRAGRRRIIGHNMTYGNTLYGLGIPYVLGVSNGSVLAGIQLVSLAGGLYLSLNYTSEMDLPTGRANFQIAGSSMGLYSIYALISLIGWENWFDIDVDGKLTIASMMGMVPMGMLYADRLYQRLGPSDGQAVAVIGGASLGAAHGFLTHLIATPDAADIGANWLRVNTLLTAGAFAAGGYFSWELAKNMSLSTGDVSLLAAGAGIGLMNWFELVAILEPDSFRAATLLLMLTVDAHILGAYRMIKPYDLTVGEAAIVGLGSMAGNATFRGLTLLLQADQGGKGMLLGDIISRLLGAYFTFQVIDPQQNGTASRDAGASLALQPALLWHGNRPVPGLGLAWNF